MNIRCSMIVLAGAALFRCSRQGASGHDADSSGAPSESAKARVDSPVVPAPVPASPAPKSAPSADRSRPASSGIHLISLTPSSGSLATGEAIKVMLTAKGLTPTGNTVHFGPVTL